MAKMKKPHILVDAFPLIDKHFSGVGHYTLGIVRGFEELAAEGKITYSLIVPRATVHELRKYELQNYTRIVRNPIPNRVVRGFMKYHIRFPIDLFTGQGVYYFPSFLAWPLWFNKSTVVVHDVTYLAVPECVDKGNREYLARVVPFSLRNAQNVVAVSEFSKSEIIKYYSLDPNQVSVAHPSVDRRHFYRRSKEEVRSVRLKYDIYEEQYILSVGNLEPRKNYGRLIDAYIALPRAITDKYPLVIVGAGGWNNDGILGKIQQAKENGYKIIHPKQFVLDKDMPALYTGAKFFIFVPIYEGFGMSPMEAYACGTPTLASNAASVPEAAGKAALYADPFSTEDITAKMQQMLAGLQEDPHRYDDAMKAHLESLNWRASAEKTAAALTGLPIDYFKKEVVK
jgi:glycosyltransferase involved in cell wall biosynthesis